MTKLFLYRLTWPSFALFRSIHHYKDLIMLQYSKIIRALWHSSFKPNLNKIEQKSSFEFHSRKNTLALT